MSSSARSKKSSSPDFPFAIFSRIGASYEGLFLIAFSKIVGFEVSPVTDKFIDVPFERACIQQVTRDVIEPEALTQVVK